MIVYFADRKLNILGQASTRLPQGLMVTDDTKDEDVESGVAVFECEFAFARDTRAKVEACVKAGNYILRKHDDETEFYTIIDSEIDIKKQTAFVYAEDAGLDLLNEVVGPYEADQAYSIDHYVEKFAYDSGFEIGINEAEGLTRLLTWDGEDTVTARLASVAKQFDGCEISFSYDIKGLRITNKKINIYKKRGKDIGTTLRLNKEIDNIVIKETIVNVATALRSAGGTPDKSSEILEVSSDAGSPKILYGVSLETMSRTADSVQITADVEASLDSKDATFGKDYVLTASIYMGGEWHSTTIKEADKEWKGTTRHSKEYTFTVSGIPSAAVKFTDIKFKVARSDSKGGDVGILAEKACGTHIVTNYIKGGVNGDGLANRPMTLEGYEYDDGDFYVDGDTVKCRSAVQQWSRYINPTEKNLKAGHEGHIVRLFSFDTVSQEELCAQTIAQLKKLIDSEKNYEADILVLPKNTKVGDRVNIVDESGEFFLSTRLLQLKSSVVRQEQKATLGEFLIKESGISEKVEDLANKFAEEAEKNREEREEAEKKAEEAEEAAKDAADSADKAEQDASNASQSAQEAQDKAAEAEQAAKDAADAAAQAKADAATATESLTQAQESAREAAENAATAKENASKAEEYATDAISTANAAKTDAEKAVNDIASLGGRLDTVSNTMEAEYARKTDLTEAEASLRSEISQNAAEISTTVSKVQVIDETVNNAKEQAENAQAAANAAQAAADQAVANSGDAEKAAYEAQKAAHSAQAAADKANTAADEAQVAANEAKAKLSQAEVELEAAQQNLANVTADADATEEEIAEARAAVEKAQAAAAQARTDATQAQNDADKAKADAATAEQVAATAKAEADAAQAAAAQAKKEADEAIATANSLAKRVTEAETKIRQNSEQIELRATKTEVTETLGGYYTKEETNAAITTASNNINMTVDSKIDAVKVVGRNLLKFTKTLQISKTADSKASDGISKNSTVGKLEHTGEGARLTFGSNDQIAIFVPLAYDGCIANGEKVTLSFDYRGNITTPGTFRFIKRNSTSTADVDLTSIAPLVANETAWQHYVATFSSSVANTNTNYAIVLFYGNGSCSSNKWVEIKTGSLKLERGTKATEWTPATEDMASNADIDAVNSEIATVSEYVSSLDIKADGIAASVKEVETKAYDAISSVNGNIETLTQEVSAKMTSEAVELQIKSAMENGTSKVVTETGFTFDANGMTVEKSGSEMKTQITEDGMTVYQNNDAVLTANNQGVDAKNLHATTYLIVGGRSRFENFGENRTGCFWIGG